MSNNKDCFDIKDIILRISKLNQKEKVHILNILKTKNIEFTKNANGYFFNFLNIKEDVIEKIHGCLVLIEENTDLIKQMEKRRNELIQYYKLLIEERLQKNIKQKKENYIKKLILKKISEIYLVKKRKNIIKRKNINPNIDIDILIKEHLKSQFKYTKNSVYHRLITSIKLSKSNKGISKGDDNDDAPTEIKSEVKSEMSDIDTINDVFDIESELCLDECEGSEKSYNEESDDDEVNDDEINDEVNDDELNDDNHINIKINRKINQKIKIKEHDKKEHDEKENDEKENDEKEDDEKEDDEKEDDEKEDDEKEDESQMEFLYYKRLLNKQGFVFDENKGCLLVFQEYIQ